MTTPIALSSNLLQEKRAERPEWTLENKSIMRRFTFRDFSQAFAFMTRVAMIAEQLNHHPEWSNVYNQVTIQLSTHDAGGLTALDFEMAARIDSIFKD